MIPTLRLAKYALAAVSALAIGLVAWRAYAKKKLLPMPACDDSIQAVHFGGTRDLSSIRLLVLHDTESDDAKTAALWFANPASGGSAHYVVDDSECYHPLGDDVVPWGAKGDRANEDGIHVEQAGHYDWTRDQWLAHRATIEKAAAIAQNKASDYGIPLVWLTADDLKAQGESARGITSHVEITRAFGVDDHIDPGSNYPTDVFMQIVTGKA